MFTPDLQIGEKVKNNKICEIFKCSPQGGMRRSLKTNTLVIVSNHYKSIYGDRWTGTTLHYTGMGMKGDQSLTSSQNRTLAESEDNGVHIHLFEVFGPKGSDYHYRGEVYLADNPYEEEQPDKEKNIRKVWVFPLKLRGASQSPIIDFEDLKRSQQKHKAAAAALRTSDLLRLVINAPRQPGMNKTVANRKTRNPYIAEYARRRAKGICELCDEKAPFETKKGEPFLEVHHLNWLSNGGEDSIHNVVAICPNCHRKMHIVNNTDDVQKLFAKRQMDKIEYSDVN